MHREAAVAAHNQRQKGVGIGFGKPTPTPPNDIESAIGKGYLIFDSLNNGSLGSYLGWAPSAIGNWQLAIGKGYLIFDLLNIGSLVLQRGVLVSTLRQLADRRGKKKPDVETSGVLG